MRVGIGWRSRLVNGGETPGSPPWGALPNREVSTKESADTLQQIQRHIYGQEYKSNYMEILSRRLSTLRGVRIIRCLAIADVSLMGKYGSRERRTAWGLWCAVRARSTNHFPTISAFGIAGGDCSDSVSRRMERRFLIFPVRRHRVV
jgi:hypothetical protein